MAKGKKNKRPHSVPKILTNREILEAAAKRRKKDGLGEENKLETNN